MTEKSPEELAEDYLAALEDQPDEADFQEANERLDALKTRLEKFEEQYGSSDPATQELREKVESAENDLEERERERQQPAELEQDVLEAATSFVLDKEWLQPQVIEALNRALLGEPHPSLRVDDNELSEPSDAEQLDDPSRYDAIDVVRKIAMDKLGRSNALEETWESIEGSAKEDAFRVAAERGSADPEDVVRSLDENIDREVARNRLKNAVYGLEISPYHREGSTYALSTAGRYIAEEYVESEITQEDGEVRREDDTSDQTTLLGDQSAAAGGDSDE